MPALDHHHWQEKFDAMRPCHYGNWWLDTYADLVRKAAVRRIFPRRIFPGRYLSVLDVGCGDGRFGAWIQRAFGCSVFGIDAYHWSGVEDRLDCSMVADAEDFDAGVGRFDLAVCVTSLPFMRDWRKAVKNLCDHIPIVLVVENLQTPTPPWQCGLPEKTPIDYPTLLFEFSRHGFYPSAESCVNVLDRRLFMWLPKPVAFAVTLCIDLLAGYFLLPRQGRYSAVLFRRGRPW